MKTLFNKGDKVVSKTDPTYKGIVTKVKYVPKKGLTFGDFQWLWLDNNPTPCGFTSEHFKLDTDENI